MAIIWSCEIISQFFNSEFIVSDILHCLQGLVIFAIFVLHKNTRELILKEYNIARGNQTNEQTKDNSQEDNSEGDFRRSD